MAGYTLRFILEPKDLGYFLEKEGFIPVNKDFNPLLREYTNKDNSITLEYMLSKKNYVKEKVNWVTIEECSFWSKLKITSDKARKAKKLTKKLIKHYKEIADINKYWKKLGNLEENLANSIDQDYEKRKKGKNKRPHEGLILEVMADMVETIKNNTIKKPERYEYMDMFLYEILPKMDIDDSFIDVFKVKHPITGEINYDICKEHFRKFCNHIKYKNKNKQLPVIVCDFSKEKLYKTKNRWIKILGKGVDCAFINNNLKEYLLNEVFSKKLNLTPEETKKIWEKLDIN